MMQRGTVWGRAGCAALALCLLLSGCGGAGSAPAAASGPAASGAGSAAAQDTAESAASAAASLSPSPAPTATPPPQYTGFGWEKEPFLEADGLVSVTLFRGNEEEHYNSYGLVSRDGFCKVYRDGKVGLLAPDGSWIAECEYDWITCGYGERYLLEKRVDDGSEWGRIEEYVLDENGRPRLLEPGERNPDGSDVVAAINGTSVNTVACWVESEERLYGYAEMALYDFYEGMPQYPLAAICFADDSDESMFESFAESWADKEKCALIVDGRPVSDERYQAMGCVAEGVVPVKKDGKWGLLDLTGAVVLPFAYDASLRFYNREAEDWDATGCYNATKGSIVLCQGGEYALYSTAGEELIPFGQFEQLLPVHEGKLWAKQNGLWGILRLETA